MAVVVCYFCAAGDEFGDCVGYCYAAVWWWWWVRGVCWWRGWWAMAAAFAGCYGYGACCVRGGDFEGRAVVFGYGDGAEGCGGVDYDV